MRKEARLWVFFLLPFFAWACAPGQQPPLTPATESPDGIRLGLVAAHKTLTPRAGGENDAKRLALAATIRDRTGHEVELLPSTLSTSDKKAVVLAAQQRLDLVLNIQHPAGRPDGFVSASLRNVTDGTLVEDTALPRERSKSLVDGFADWYAGLESRLGNQPRFDLTKITQRLHRERRCRDVLSLLTEENIKVDEKDLREIQAECARKVLREESQLSSRSLRYQLRLRFEGVPERYQERFAQATHSSGLQSEIEAISKRQTELLVNCQQDCRRGRIRFILPYDEMWYSGARDPKKEMFTPYQSIASVLLRFRSNAVRKRTRHFLVEVLFQALDGETLLSTVGGSVAKPSFATRQDAKSFFRTSF